MNITGLFYNFSVNQSDSNIVVMARAVNMYSDPNIYISKLNQFPKNTIDSEIASCEQKGNDYCIINQIEPNIPYYIGITCNSNCRFNLRVDFEEEYILKQNDYVQLKITNKKPSQLVSVLMEQYEDEQLEIELRIINFNELETEFEVYLVKGDQLPSSEEYDLKGEDSWYGAKVFKLQLSELQQIQKINLLIVAQEGALVEIRTKSFGKQRELMGYEKINDFVEKNQVRFYYLDLSSYPELKTPNITSVQQIIIQVLKLNQFSGQATLYVNPSFRPVLLNQYQHKSEGEKSKILILNQYNNSIEQRKFYIAIFGNQQCTYSLEIQFQNLQQLNLELNIPYDGTLQNIIHFKFKITGSEKQNITVSFTQSINYFNIALKKCFFDDCQITAEELNNIGQLSSENYNNLFTQRERQTNSIIQFEYDPVLSTQSIGQYYSYFALIIYPHTYQDTPTSHYNYQIIILTSSSHVQLKENTPHKALVNQQEFLYFKFLMNDEEVTKIQILITPIQGKVTLYASTKQKKPNSESYEKMSRENSISCEKNQNNSLYQGIYYLSVYGETAGYFMITIVPQRSILEIPGLYSWEYIQLYEGNSQDYILNKSQVGLYKIDLNQNNEISKDDLSIDLIYDKGALSMVGFDHPSQSNNGYIWKNQKQIKIPGADLNYPEILYLRILIQDNSTSIPFRITYRLGDKPITLVLGESFTGFLNQYQVQKFIYVFFQKEDIQLQKHVLSENQSDIIVTAYNMEKVFAQMSFQTEANIMASEFQFEKCSISKRDFLACEIYIHVLSYNTVNYQLLITRNDTIQRLSENSPIFQRIPESFHYYYIHYLQIAPQNIIIDVINQDFPQQLQILISLSSEGINQISQIEFPKNVTSENIFRVSKIQQGFSHSQISIYPNEINETICPFSCILTITVRKIETIKYHEASHYMIQYSSYYITLQKHRAYFDKVYQNVIKYYKIKVDDNNKNLMIVLSPITQCEVDLVVSKDSYPNFDDYQWTSRDYLGDQLIIEKDNPLITEMEGDYFLGVFGTGECSYQLIYQTGDFHYYLIQAGLPINVFLLKGEVAYFKYRNLDYKDFTIILHSNNKQAVFFVEDLDKKENDHSPFLQSVEGFSFNNDGQGYKQPFKTQSGFLTYCLIAVKAYADTDVYLQIQLDQNVFYLSQNLLIMNYIFHDDELHEYLYQSYKETQLYIRVILGNMTVIYGSQGNSQKQEVTLKTDHSINIKMFPPINHNGIYTIDISSEDNCIFEIRCSDYQGAISVNFHQNYNFELNQFQTQQFIYKSLNREETYFSILLTWNFNEADLDQINKLKQFKPVLIVNHNYNQPDLKRVLLPFSELIQDKSIYQQYSDKKGDYLIEIQNNGNYFISSEVVFGNKFINVLIPNKQMSSIIKLGQTDYWEYFCPYGGQLLVQVHQCASELNVFGSEYLDSLKNGQYSQIFQKENNQFQKLIQIQHASTYYIAVTSKFGAPYNIFAQLLHRKSYIPIHEIQPKDNRKLSWSVDEQNNQFQLTLTGNLFEQSVINNPKFKILQVKFYLSVEYLGPELFIQELRCESEDEDLIKEINLQASLTQQVIIQKLLRPEELEQAYQIRVSVYFQANVRLENREQINLQGYYEPIIFENIYKKQLVKVRMFKLALKIIIFILCLLSLIIIIKYLKKKQMQKIFRYEAKTDAYPNIEMNQQKFIN